MENKVISASANKRRLWQRNRSRAAGCDSSADSKGKLTTPSSDPGIVRDRFAGGQSIAFPRSESSKSKRSGRNELRGIYRGHVRMMSAKF